MSTAVRSTVLAFPDVPFLRRCFSPEVAEHFDRLATDYEIWERKTQPYVDHTVSFLRSFIPEGKRVLLIGCVSSRVLEGLNPSDGVGIDISPALVRGASQGNRHPNVRYQCIAPECFNPETPFDFVILLNALDHSEDVLALFGELRRFMHHDSKIVLSMLNPLWHPLVRLSSALGIRVQDRARNLMGTEAVCEALAIKGYAPTAVMNRLLWPRTFPIVAPFLNRFVARLPGFRRLCFLQYVVARPSQVTSDSPSCTVIIPCFNEEGNVRECISRVPQMGAFTEVLVVDDGSGDRTRQIAEEVGVQDNRVRVVGFEKNRGKGAAVLTGLREARGDIAMILDADMTVAPEELVDFYDALALGSAEFASGTRFVYPMERHAMRLANYLGNIFFSKIVEMIIGSKCSDTLCGTKAMFSSQFRNIQFTDSSWGDFDLIFHAARQRLKTIQVPVHYKSRVAGNSKMKAFRSGVVFLRQCLQKWWELE